MRLTPLSYLISGLVQTQCEGWKLSYSFHYARLWMPKEGRFSLRMNCPETLATKNVLLKKVFPIRTDARIYNIIISDTIGLIFNLKLRFCSSDIGTCLVHSQQLTYSLDKQICLHRLNKYGQNVVTAMIWTKLVLCNDTSKLTCLQVLIYVLIYYTNFAMTMRSCLQTYETCPW